ncbi:hypothetical protein PF008_g27882 [Phytophthora fragariae]|uniref:Uncharacterized protein n=1 Tax=Phytophthora fragariae TaxID=53985 RepID=A0A6G0QD21_9STRA|nr:hypothetical protein PF008_g27882 [Phytophthora fragariae]
MTLRLSWPRPRCGIWLISTARTRVTGQRVFPLGDTGMITYNNFAVEGRDTVTALDCRKTLIVQMAGPIPFVRAVWFIDDI